MSGCPTRRVREKQRLVQNRKNDFPTGGQWKRRGKSLASVAGWALHWCGGGEGRQEEMCQQQCQLLNKGRSYWLSENSVDDVTT